MSNQIDPPFSQGVGYGLIIGVGALFAIGMSTVAWGLERFFAEKQTSEMFMTVCEDSLLKTCHI
jgi:urea-proton symporter